MRQTGYASVPTPAPGRRWLLAAGGGLCLAAGCGRAAHGAGNGAASKTKVTKTKSVAHLPAKGTPSWPVSVATAQPSAGWSMYATRAGRVQMVTFGRDVWNHHDDCGYFYLPTKGDGVWTARVALLSPTDAWAKAGLMLRAGTDPGSAMVFCCVTVGNGAGVQWRPAKDQPATSKGMFDPMAVAPVYLSMQRKGDTYQFADSPDGKTWHNHTTLTLKGVIGSSYLAGLAVSSHQATLQGLAGFDRLNFKPLHYAAVIQTAVPANW